jgi:hypothetical protein
VPCCQASPAAAARPRLTSPGQSYASPAAMNGAAWSRVLSSSCRLSTREVSCCSGCSNSTRTSAQLPTSEVLEQVRQFLQYYEIPPQQDSPVVPTRATSPPYRVPAQLLRTEKVDLLFNSPPPPPPPLVISQDKSPKTHRQFVGIAVHERHHGQHVDCGHICPMRFFRIQRHSIGLGKVRILSNKRCPHIIS